MNFDLVRVEWRGSERKPELRFEALERRVSAQFDASLRAAAEMLAKLEMEKEMIARLERLEHRS